MRDPQYYIFDGADESSSNSFFTISNKTLVIFQCHAHILANLLGHHAPRGGHRTLYTVQRSGEIIGEIW